MGILLVLAILTGVGIWLATKFDYSIDWLSMLGGIVGIVAGICLVVASIFAICEGAFADKTYADLVAKREVIEYRLDEIENDKNLLVNGGTYTDLIEYNETIRSYKTWSNNFWNGWFYADKIADLEYIELPNKGS